MVLRLDQAYGVSVNNGHVDAQIAGAKRNTLTDRAEPDHHDLAAVQRQTCDRRERRPRLGADVVTVVNEILECDPIPVQDREWDIDAGQAVQPGRGGFKRTRRPVASLHRRRDQLTAHVAQRIGRFARQPRQRVGALRRRHAGVAADLDAHRGKMRCRAVVGAVRVAWRHSDPRAGWEEWADDTDAVGRDVLMTGHGAARQVRGRDLRPEGGGDRISPRNPFKLCRVHDSSTSREQRHVADAR